MDGETQRVVKWLRGRPFPWPQPTPLRDRLKVAWHVLRHGEEGIHSIFKLLAIKIERGDHLK